LNKLLPRYTFCFAVFFLFAGRESIAQIIRDSAGTKLEVVGDSVKRQPLLDDSTISPRKAAIRSALIPGWGQVYVRQDLKKSFFRKYWKIPIIYGAIGTSAGVFMYNLQWYRRTRFAYTTFVTKDSNNFPRVHPQLRVFETDPNTLRQARNEFRQSVDYSVLFFILLWGLNVVDATVDAHLKSFDVSPDLSLRFKPGYSEVAKTNGISLVFIFK
jgi:hypothetical protein